MGVVLFGLNDLVASMRNVAEKASRGSREAIESGARDIRDLAVRQAPVDLHNLEKAIQIGKEVDPTTRRNIYYVYVNESLPAPSEKNPGKTVGDYAFEMHEGNYNLGLQSELKQSENPDIVVGRKYLENALDSLKEDIQKKAERGLKVGIGH